MNPWWLQGVGGFPWHFRPNGCATAGAPPLGALGVHPPLDSRLNSITISFQCSERGGGGAAAASAVFHITVSARQKTLYLGNARERARASAHVHQRRPDPPLRHQKYWNGVG